MYEIRPEAVKTFIEDTTMKLPRFQRKQTWDEKKNFELAISVFRGYPLGVVVVSKDRDKNGKYTKWLIDGRQRRNALMEMQNDPEIIYVWAKKYIKFANNAQPEDIKVAYRECIDQYLGKDEDSENESDDFIDENTVTPIEDESEDEDELMDEEYDYSDLSGLELLQKIILTTHKKNKFNSQFSRPFDFSDKLKKLNYVEKIDGKTYLNSRKLKTFISTFLKETNLDEINEGNFYSYLTRYEDLDEKDKRNLKSKIKDDWDRIKERISLIDQIDKVLQEAKIGLIELSDVRLADSQKIFEIINTKGTKLSAVEVLSAKPQWNISVQNPSENFNNAVQELYKNLEIQNLSPVTWDIPATFISRLKNKEFLFRNYQQTSTDIEKKITLGFKLLSALIEKGITKVHISNLSEADIDWKTYPEEILTDLSEMLKIISNTAFFSFFQQWGKNIMELLSDTIALNFVTIMYLDWKRKNKPSGSSSITKRFEKNSVILFDALIYEYLTQQWRGSSDSKLSRNIDNFNVNPDLFTPIENTKWTNLLMSMINDHKINESSLKKDGIDKYIQTFLYYYYSIRNVPAPQGSDVKVDFDHIIPRTIWQNSSLERKDILQNNLINIAILPKKDNIQKTDKKLSQIDDPWLIHQIEIYEEIEKSKFKEFSDLTNIDSFMEYRKNKLLKFIETREKFFIN